MRHNDVMLTAIITASATIIGAIIGAIVVLRAKRVDLIGQIDQRRSEPVRNAYHTAMAGFDSVGHYRCHLNLKHYGYDMPFEFDWKKDWPPLRSKLEQTILRGSEKLRETSLDYDQVAGAFAWLHDVTFDGVTPDKLKALPDDYEKARNVLYGFIQFDDRRRKPFGKKFWKKLSKIHRPKSFEDLEKDDRMRRIAVLSAVNPNVPIVYQGAPGDSESNAIIEYIQQFEKEPPQYAWSLTRTLERMKDWQKSGIIDYDTPCAALETPCYQQVNELIAERNKDH